MSSLKRFLGKINLSLEHQKNEFNKKNNNPINKSLYQHHIRVQVLYYFSFY